MLLKLPQSQVEEAGSDTEPGSSVRLSLPPRADRGLWIVRRRLRLAAERTLEMLSRRSRVRLEPGRARMKALASTICVASTPRTLNTRECPVLRTGWKDSVLFEACAELVAHRIASAVPAASRRPAERRCVAFL